VYFLPVYDRILGRGNNMPQYLSDPDFLDDGNTPIPGKRKMSHKGKIPSHDIERQKIYKKRVEMEVQLRISGLSYKDIADAVKLQFRSDEIPPNYCDRNVYKDIHEAFQRRDNIDRESIRIARQIEADRLDALFMVAYNSAINGNVKSINTALNIMERRAKMLGLDKPVQVKVETWKIEVLDLVRTGKMTIEDIRRELGPELTREVLESGGESLVEGVFVDAPDADGLDEKGKDTSGKNGGGVAGGLLALGRRGSS